ncbi:MAG: Lrp/AsnC family transcriptional regulator [Candidatus Woesearchaeota archaeon]
MKEKDILLLASLRKNARETLTKMSQQTHIPISTIFDKLKQFEKEVIKKHTTLVDFGKIGFSTRANITLKVDKSDKEDIRCFLEKHMNVNSVYKINNGYDYLVEAVFRNIKELEDFIDIIETKHKIKNKQVYYIIEDIKREEFLAEPGFIDLVMPAA